MPSIISRSHQRKDSIDVRLKIQLAERGFESDLPLKHNISTAKTCNLPLATSVKKKRPQRSSLSESSISCVSPLQPLVPKSRNAIRAHDVIGAADTVTRCWLVQEEIWQNNGKGSVGSSHMGARSVAWLRPERLEKAVVKSSNMHYNPGGQWADCRRGTKTSLTKSEQAKVCNPLFL